MCVCIWVHNLLTLRQSLSCYRKKKKQTRDDFYVYSFVYDVAYLFFLYQKRQKKTKLRSLVDLYIPVIMVEQCSLYSSELLQHIRYYLSLYYYYHLCLGSFFCFLSTMHLFFFLSHARARLCESVFCVCACVCMNFH